MLKLWIPGTISRLAPYIMMLLKKSRLEITY